MPLEEVEEEATLSCRRGGGIHGRQRRRPSNEAVVRDGDSTQKNNDATLNGVGGGGFNKEMVAW